MDVLAREVVGVLAHVEGADEHRAGSFEARDQRAVALGRRAFAIDLGAGAGRKPGYVEEVLDRERNARERARRSAGRDAAVDRVGARERALPVTSVNAFVRPSTAAIRASAASATAAALVRRDETSPAISAAEAYAVYPMPRP